MTPPSHHMMMQFLFVFKDKNGRPLDDLLDAFHAGDKQARSLLKQILFYLGQNVS
jgi:hypothetical protein